MLVSEPDIWEPALVSFIVECKPELLQLPTFDDESTEEEQLITLGTAALATKAIPHLATVGDIAPTQQLFQYIVAHHLRFSGPVFYMPGQGRLSMSMCTVRNT